MRRVLKYRGIALGLLVLIPASYIAYLYVSYVDETVTSGSAYGFTIGQSKSETFRLARERFEAGHIAGMETVASREGEHRLHPWLLVEFHDVGDVRDRFDQWSHWGLWLAGEEPELLAIVNWHGPKVSGVGQPGQQGDLWRPRVDVAGLSIASGDTYEEVYETVTALARTPGHEDLALRTGWMAKRQPVEFAEEEFRFVERYDDWRLFVGDERSYFNTIRLTFSSGALTEIHRHRQNFELP